MERGILAGFPMVDISVELYDGSYHDVDSSEIAFKIAASMAFQEAAAEGEAGHPRADHEESRSSCRKSSWATSPATSPASAAQIEGMEERGMNKVVNAKVPLSEMFGYTTTLRSMTEGRGSMTMEFDHYEVVPNNVATDIIASRK